MKYFVIVNATDAVDVDVAAVVVAVVVVAVVIGF